jgi:hypothetical protein
MTMNYDGSETCQSSGRGSGHFRFERDLVAVLRDSSPAALNLTNGPCRVLSEMQVGMRIPDLLLVFGASGAHRAPLKLTYFDCAIVAAVLDAGPTSVSELAHRTYASDGEIAHRVERLIRLRLLERRGDASLQAQDGTVPQDVRVVAVEAKLTRWKEALTQAQGCLAFANEAYIAMPGSVVRSNVPAMEACALAGVGVIAVDEGGSSVLLDAEHRQRVTAEWVRVVSSAVGLSHVRAPN